MSARRDDASTAPCLTRLASIQSQYSLIFGSRILCEAIHGRAGSRRADTLSRRSISPRWLRRRTQFVHRRSGDPLRHLRRVERDGRLRDDGGERLEVVCGGERTPPVDPPRI